MDIRATLIIGIIAFGIYSLFALFVHRKERLKIIDKVDFSKITDSKVDLNMNVWSGKKFSGLRTGLLLMGIGLGLLVGFFIISNSTYLSIQGNNYYTAEAKSIIYGAGVLLFGGAGLLAAYLIERNSEKKK